jgi:hypothetical protein
MGTVGKMQPPGAAIGRVGTALDKTCIGEAINHAADGNGFDIERFREPGLVDAFRSRQDEQHLPLGAADAKAARTAIEATPQ